MTKTLSLDQVELAFDPATANILLTSGDPRLSGSLKLTISAQTESYRTLLKLLVDEGITDLNGAELPQGTLRVDSAQELWIPGKDPRFNLLLGQGRNRKPIETDLRRNILVAGGSGSGKSVVLRSILCSGLEQDDVEIRAIDLKKVSLGGYAYREQDRFASTKDEALELILALEEELMRRIRAFGTLDPHNPRPLPRDGAELGYPVIYLIIDEIAPLTRLSEHTDSATLYSNGQSSVISSVLREIAKKGKSFGIYLVLGSQEAQSIDPNVLDTVYERVLMGRSNRVQSQIIFGSGSSESIGAAYLAPRGRGVIGYGDYQELFQSFFIPYGAYWSKKLS